MPTRQQAEQFETDGYFIADDAVDPDLFDEPVFAAYLMSKPVMDYVHHFIGTDLSLGSILLFTNPHHADYSIGWHRDWGKLERDPDYDAERAILCKPQQLGLASCHRRRAPALASARRRARQPSRGPAALLRPLARPAGAMKLP